MRVFETERERGRERGGDVLNVLRQKENLKKGTTMAKISNF